MYQFTSFDAEEFYAAVRAKDYVTIKSYIVSAIRNNPAFRKAPGQDASEVALAIEILEEWAQDIFEKYEIQEGEHPFNEAEADTWNKDYFNRQSFLLKKNFCKKRLNHLKQIGQKISNFQEPQGQEARLEQSLRPKTRVLSRGSEPQKRRLTGVAIIVGIIILILIVVLVAKTAAAPATKTAAAPVVKPGAVFMANTIALK